MKKKLLALFLALVMVGAVLPGCGDGSKDPGGQGNNGKTGEPVKGGEITVGIAQDLDDSLDPHQTVAAGTREVLFNIFEGLVKPNSDGEMIPAVAEKYTLSEDGTTYTFTLREGVKFHNGQTVTAEDVVYSINRCAAVPEGQEKPLVAAFSAVKSVEALDEKTVAVTIAQRDLEFISYMTAAIIPADYENQDTAPVGTGPFKFVSRTPQQDFVMERFEDYWGAPAWLDKVTYKICENADALVMNLNGGSIDLCAHLTSAQASQLNQNFQVLEGTMNLVQAIYLNNQAKPFDNQLVRQALCYAIDRQAIIDTVLLGQGMAAYGPLQRNIYNNENVEHYDYNPEKAKSILESAGCTMGSNGYYERNGEEIGFVISVMAGEQDRIDIAQAAAQQLRDVGIHCTVDIPAKMDWGGQQACLIGWGSPFDADDHTYKVFGTDKGANYSGYSNEKVDEYLTKARESSDPAVRKEFYALFQQELANDPAYAFICYIDANYVASSRLHGISTDTVMGHHGVGIFWNVREWTLD